MGYRVLAEIFARRGRAHAQVAEGEAAELSRGRARQGAEEIVDQRESLAPRGPLTPYLILSILRRVGSGSVGGRAVVRDIIAAGRLDEMERGLRIDSIISAGMKRSASNKFAQYNARADAVARAGGRTA